MSTTDNLTRYVEACRADGIDAQSRMTDIIESVYEAVLDGWASQPAHQTEDEARAKARRIAHQISHLFN